MTLQQVLEGVSGVIQVGVSLAVLTLLVALVSLVKAARSYVAERVIAVRRSNHHRAEMWGTPDEKKD